MALLNKVALAKMGPEAKRAKILDHQTSTKDKLMVQPTTKVATM